MAKKSTEMKAAVYKPNSPQTSFLGLEDLPAPQLKADHEGISEGAIVKVLGCGVCGSDLLKLDRKLVKEGAVLGHEMVGEIFEISEENSKKYNLKKRDRILSSHHVPCGWCSYCLNGKESLCKQFKSTNFEPGAFCEYLKLSNEHLEKTVLKIPDALSDLEASFTEPVACSLKAIKKSGIANYQGPTKVGIIGLGSIGQILGQLVKLYWNGNPENELIGADLLENKLKLASENGFDKVGIQIDANEGESKFDFIFLASGASPTVDIALENIKDGGTIVVFASVPDDEVSFSNNQIYFRELNIISSYSPNLEDLKESLDLIADSKIQVQNLVSHKAGSLEELGETIIKAKEESGTKVYLELSSRD